MLFSEYCLYGRDGQQVLSTAHEVLGLSTFAEDQVGAANPQTMLCSTHWPLVLTQDHFG